METWLLLVVVVQFYKPALMAPPSTATIAFITINNDNQSLRAVKSAIMQVNSDLLLLPNTTLQLSNSVYSHNDVLDYAENLTSDKTLALFLNGQPSPSQELVSGLLQIPLVTTPARHQDDTRFNVISLAPCRREINQAIYDVIMKYQWTTVLVLFDIRWRNQASDFLTLLPSSVEREVLELVLDQDGKLFEETKKKLKKLNNKLVEVITLFCDADLVTVVMEEIHVSYSRTAERSHHWILADMLPSFTMVTERSQIVLAFTPHIDTNVHSQRLMADLSMGITNIKNHSFYLYDSVLTFAHALNNVIKSGQWVAETKVVNVEESKNGKKILEEMKKVNIVGATGSIRFYSTGDRKGAVLDVMNLRSNTFFKMGNWSIAGLKVNGAPEMTKKNSEVVPLNKLNRKLKIILARDSPFFMVTKDPKTGEYKKIGYSVDLVDALAKILHFKYKFVESPDGEYGTQLPDGSFNGIMGEVIKKKVDISAAPLTITSERHQHIMFSKPFMQFSMDVISQKPKAGEIDILAFMMPYSIPVWLMTLACLAFMSLLLTALNHFSPFGHKHGENDGTGVEFNLFNSFWFSLASMLCQGGDNTPKSLSGRVLVGCFWFCVLIWVSTYTANLAAFFSFRQTATAINSLQDIIDRNYILHIQIGTSLEHTLNYSNYDTYKKLYRKILADGSFVTSALNGMKAVRADAKHLHMEEHPYAEAHIHQKPCDLVSIKGFMGVRGYGFAMSKDFPYASNISVALLKLQESGVLEDLTRKWWSYRSQCHKSFKRSTTERLGLSNMVGLYMLIAVGCVLGITTMLVEMVWMKNGELQGIKKKLCCFKKDEKDELIT